MLKTAKAAQLRHLLKEVYNRSGKPEDLDHLSEEEIMQLAEHLSDGVPFATPVFDGAAEKEIHAMLDLAYPEEVAKRLPLEELSEHVIDPTAKRLSGVFDLL